MHAMLRAVQALIRRATAKDASRVLRRRRWRERVFPSLGHFGRIRRVVAVNRKRAHLEVGIFGSADEIRTRDRLVNSEGWENAARSSTMPPSCPKSVFQAPGRIFEAIAFFIATRNLTWINMVPVLKIGRGGIMRVSPTALERERSPAKPSTRESP